MDAGVGPQVAWSKNRAAALADIGCVWVWLNPAPATRIDDSQTILENLIDYPRTSDFSILRTRVVVQSIAKSR
jgi:hypothetical protein